MNKPENKDRIKEIYDGLSKIDENGKKSRTGRFVVSALSSIPWVGGVIAASSALHGEKEQGKVNALQKLWLEEHHQKIEELAFAIHEITEKLNQTGRENDVRLSSEDYLGLVRKGFKEWDNSETQEKKQYIQRLLTNAGATTLTTDDLIRLFIDWISMYHETHFMVIKEVYKNKGITRGQIWHNLNAIQPREDSVEADLFKLLIRDLSMGGIIIQHRETDYWGNYVKKPTKRSKSGVLKSAFDNEEQYELTELGSQFVHYTMENVITQIENI
jgi:hypothetical protein